MKHQNITIAPICKFPTREELLCYFLNFDALIWTECCVDPGRRSLVS
jgi:hypothetical protein